MDFGLEELRVTKAQEARSPISEQSKNNKYKDAPLHFKIVFRLKWCIFIKNHEFRRYTSSLSWFFCLYKVIAYNP
ncbi:hypothetical protein CSC2_19230 [Clostridium zeae]|uniref:Uncharacterized protein n=1 Tax=Clostridium zeae TaxID=2759022 RepID=A0ABQ1E9C8_9CLOT|nr:hypothetical protein CSC2_19230 [Clostridium zeae]